MARKISKTKTSGSDRMRDKDKYLKIVEWSSEDNCYVGSVPGWIGKCCHGDDELKVYQDLSKILDERIDIYKDEKRK